MKIEPVSGSLFTINLNETEMRHLLALSMKDRFRMLDVLKLWFEIGFLTSQTLLEKVELLCELNKSTNVNSS